MAKAQDITGILQAMDVSALEVGKVESREGLMKQLNAFKTVIAANGSVEATAITKVKYLWKVNNPNDIYTVDRKMGYPSNFDELKEMVTAKKIPHITQSHEGYMEYLTAGEYNLETRDWVLYETGLEVDEKSKTEGSAFFTVRKGGTKAPVDIWRKTAERSRDVLQLFLKDKFICEDFLVGKFDCWNTLVTRLHSYAGMEDYEEKYARITELTEKLKQIIPSKDSYRVKFGRLMSILGPYFVTERGDIEHGDWSNEKISFTGPEEKYPILHLIMSALAMWNIRPDDLVKAEDDFLKTYRNLEPKTFAINRAAWHDLVARVRVKGFGANINFVNKIDETEREWEDVQEDDFDDNLVEKIDKILVIRNRRWGTKKFVPRKNGGAFQRVKERFGQNQNNTSKPLNQKPAEGRDLRRGPFRGKCYNCGKVGHTKARCTARKKEGIRAVEDVTPMNELANSIREEMNSDVHY